MDKMVPVPSNAIVPERDVNKTPILETHHLGIDFGGLTAVDEFSLTVGRTEIAGLIGPNGAGKTTAMKIMTGLAVPERGDAYLNGFSILNDYEKAMASVGCIIENVCMFPYLTAYENMKLCARFYPEADEERLRWALSETGMYAFNDEIVKYFSLGLRQRIGISLAILSKPIILILDEPLNGLDVEGMVDMRNLFKHLSEENGTTVFISSHLIHDVEVTCDRVGVVFDGKLLATNRVDDILKDYSSLENYYLSEVDANSKS